MQLFGQGQKAMYGQAYLRGERFVGTIARNRKGTARGRDGLSWPLRKIFDWVFLGVILLTILSSLAKFFTKRTSQNSYPRDCSDAALTKTPERFVRRKPRSGTVGTAYERFPADWF